MSSLRQEPFRFDPTRFVLFQLAFLSFGVAALYYYLFRSYFEISSLTPRNLAAIVGFAAFGLICIAGSRIGGLRTAVERLAHATRGISHRTALAAYTALIALGTFGAFAFRLFIVRPPAWLEVQYLPLLLYAAGISFIGAIFVIQYQLRAASRGPQWLLVGLNVVYISFLVLNPLSGESIILADDTPDYLGQSSFRYLFNRNVWVGFRPFTLPLFFTLLGNDLTAMVAVQSFLHVLAWSLLAWVVTASTRSAFIKIIGFASILLLSLTPQVHAWNHIMLSESLSLTFLVALLGLLLLTKAESGLPHYTAVFIIASLAVGTRDSNVFSLVFFAISVVLISVTMKQKTGRPLLVAALILTVSALLGYTGIKQAGRDVHFLSINMFSRVLPFPERVAFFQEQGMPDLGNPQSRHEITTLPADSEYKLWAAEHLQTTYAKMLIQEFPNSVIEPFRVTFFPTNYNGQNLWSEGDYQPLLEKSFIAQIEFREWTLERVAIFSLAGMLAILGMVRHRHALGTVAIVLALVSIPSFILTWHGDPGELGRHSLTASVQFKLGMIFAMLCTLDLGAVYLDKRLDRGGKRKK